MHTYRHIWLIKQTSNESQQKKRFDRGPSDTTWSWNGIKTLNAGGGSGAEAEAGDGDGEHPLRSEQCGATMARDNQSKAIKASHFSESAKTKTISPK